MNRLRPEPSPYLRQHADNPVHWWPWSDAAFDEARRRDVPVFLSIGYSTCHWCHVMAHESFEDEEVAALLNEAFVCVKVDREERPDVDDAYMSACQAMTGSGGWPLTAILTPDRKPFFAGTYFPKASRMGRMGMMELVPTISEAWRKRREELVRHADHIWLHVQGVPHAHGDESVPSLTRGAPMPLDESVLRRARDVLAARHDAKHGGFGTAPKFPSAHLLMFLMRWHHRSGDEQALTMVRRTLDAMAQGGIFDHLGGGFHRYSTDPEWLVPHFEKMLYDQAMLAMAYAEAHALTGAYQAPLRATLDYVLRDLSDPAGGFRCAEDADSEGEEGKFYVFRRSEVESLAGGRLLADAYGLTEAGNFRDEAHGRRTGANILHLRGALPAAEDLRLAPVRARLLELRNQRPRPHLDDKVLTDWNGLTIAAFAFAGRILGESRYVFAAARAADFLRTMRREDGLLTHRYRDGAKDDHAFLDDHAFVLWGLIELYQATWQPKWLTWAVELAGVLERHFRHERGGFVQVPAGRDELRVKRRECYDGALPSGNSVAAHALLRLGHLSGDPRWTKLGETCLESFSREVTDHPAASAMMLCALDLALGPSREVLLTGTGPEAEAMVNLTRTFLPRTVFLRNAAGLGAVAPWTQAMDSGRVAAYVCEGNACKNPVTTAAALRPILAATIPQSRAPAL